MREPSLDGAIGFGRGRVKRFGKRIRNVQQTLQFDPDQAEDLDERMNRGSSSSGSMEGIGGRARRA